MFTSCKCGGPELEELGRIRRLDSPQFNYEPFNSNSVKAFVVDKVASFTTPKLGHSVTNCLCTF
jgi:hypothetical protein